MNPASARVAAGSSPFPVFFSPDVHPAASSVTSLSWPDSIKEVGLSPSTSLVLHVLRDKLAVRRLQSVRNAQMKIFIHKGAVVTQATCNENPC